jgi:arylsulfatase A-like enzyme
MFTGRYPMAHGAHYIAYQPKHEGAPHNARPLNEKALTLGEVFHAAGYRTGYVSANVGYLSPSFGLTQGFEHLDIEHLPAAALSDRMIQWLRTTGNQPFLGFINFMDAHWPYTTAPVAHMPSPPEMPDRQFMNSIKGRLMGTDEGAYEEDLERLSKLYGYGVANADAGVGKILAYLRKVDLYDDTVVIVVSDHGEFLGEHGLVAHGMDIYQETIHVPLLVKGVGQGDEASVDKPISLTQIPRLVMEGAQFAGRDEALHLMRACRPDDPIIAEQNYCPRPLANEKFEGRFDRIRRTLLDEGYKFIEDSDGQHELYNLEMDPGEMNNLYAPEAQRATRLRDELATVIAKHLDPDEAGDAVELDTQMQENLEALGYL